MSWTIEPVEISEIRRQKQLPNYGYIEQSISGGSAYSIGGNGSAGYFIVASESSLAPGFVVELSLPELAVTDEYAALAAEMNKRSSGVLWFDSSDRDACDFAWRLGLPLRSGPPLFCCDGLQQDISLEDLGFNVKVANSADQPAVIKLLTSAPPDAGGQTREAVIENLNGRCILVLRKNSDIIGTAVLSPLPGPYLALSSVVMETYSELPLKEHETAHHDLELLFMNLLASEAANKNLKLVYSMARQTPSGYLEAMKLKMKLIKQSFMASFGTVW